MKSSEDPVVEHKGIVGRGCAGTLVLVCVSVGSAGGQNRGCVRHLSAENLEGLMARKTCRISLRLSEAEDQELTKAAKARGYSSPCAFIRAAIKHELADRSELSDA